MLIKVKATQTGYDGYQLQPKGSVFEIEESKFSENWMERVDKQSPEPATVAEPESEVNESKDSDDAPQAAVEPDTNDEDDLPTSEGAFVLKKRPKPKKFG